MTCVIFLGMSAIAESPLAARPLAADRLSKPLAADSRSRAFQPSQRLPAGPSLAAQYAVSRGVVRAALSGLRSGGFVAALVDAERLLDFDVAVLANLGQRVAQGRVPGRSAARTPGYRRGHPGA